MTERPRTVLVVGAGPAGLQAAIAAARRGHRVEVVEAADEVGGQVRLAASVPNRAEFGDLVRNQVAECERHDVKIRTGVTADVALVRAEHPDVVVVATGSAPTTPWWAPERHDRIVAVHDVLAGTVEPAGTVVVFDELGFHQCTSVADLLADRGCAVEIVTPGMVVGQDLGVTLDMESWWMRAAAKGIVQTTDTLFNAIDLTDPDHPVAVGVHHPTGTEVAKPFDWLVLTIQQAPVADLYFELVAAGIDVHRVGDAVTPRRAHAAVIDGERIGTSL